MSIGFQCTSCDAEFDLEIPRIIDRPTAVKCPKCESRLPAHRTSALGTALEDLLAAMAAIRTTLRFQLKLDTEQLPPPYGPSHGEGEGLIDDSDDLDDGADDDEDEDDAKDDDDDDDEDDDDDDDDDDEEEEEEVEKDDADDVEDDDDDDDDDEEEEEEEDE